MLFTTIKDERIVIYESCDVFSSVYDLSRERIPPRLGFSNLCSLVVNSCLVLFESTVLFYLFVYS